ncbi:MAG: 1-(5-phosphoribosyl)-5-[(5-phosphoribosylamino)methylideneamino]imidazole-4-carboxamide isomerase [Chloroflexi bacterium]|nr:1-(5-phosphoribosyl)-5-[(5-phosphoribosylamino)methylideneamino]imidazole-4-carboxamide isomerase [Chloroflexota bacterium]
MEVIPAIDLRDGRCVRLVQGDYQRETVYSDDPAAVARRWQDLGAPRLHVVDLDGAAGGAPRNLAAIRAILDAVRLPVQVGGGIRSLEVAGRLLGLGVDRVVFGTVAVRQPELVADACRQFGPAAVVVGVDARNGQVAVSGWREQESLAATDLVRQMEAIGVQRFVYTDIARDGTLAGPNLDALAALVAQTPARVIASGGVSGVEDIRRLRPLGVEGVIVGRALYTGDLDLPAALRAAAE